MPRKGYTAEYFAKMKFSKRGVAIKTASNRGMPDFVVIQPIRNTLNRAWEVSAYEVKSTVKKKYYPSARDKRQWKEFAGFMELSGIPVYYMIVMRKRPKNEVRIMTHKEFGIEHAML